MKQIAGLTSIDSIQQLPMIDRPAETSLSKQTFRVDVGRFQKWYRLEGWRQYSSIHPEDQRPRQTRPRQMQSRSAG
jgi:hypothetical protein